MGTPFRSWWHLARRFVGSLRPGPPSAGDEVWARWHLRPGEQEIWAQMSNPDRRHAVGVARAVVVERPEAERVVVAAALLHDSGKVVSRLRTPWRVAATVWWTVADEERADRWLARPPGRRRRLAEYRRHPELGAQRLAAAGSDRLTVRWAAEHHAPEATWTVPLEIGRLLKACDDD